MIERLESYQEVAAYLEDGKTVHTLVDLKRKWEQRQFFLPFIGQFSVGKSALINRLVGRNVLPSKGTETTAVVTTIQYGEEESVWVHTTEGDVFAIDFDDLLAFQESSKQEFVWGDQAVASIQVQICHDLLKDGLILVDTPGLNTLIESHETFTYSILPQSHYLVYVMGKPVTDMDLTIIDQLVRLGIEVLFVRTKLDDVKTNEEDLEATMANDRRILSAQLNREVRYFGLSNEQMAEDSPLHEAFSSFSRFMKDYVAQNLQRLMEDTLSKRLSAISGELGAKLADRQTFLDQYLTEDATKLEEQIKAVDQEIGSLQGHLRDMERDVRRRFSPATRELIDEFRGKSREGNIVRFRERLKAITTLEELQQQAEMVAKQTLDEFLSVAKSRTDQQLKDVVQASFSACSEQWESMNHEWNRLFGSSFSLQIEAPTLRHLEENQHFAVQRMEDRLREIDHLLEQSDVKLAEFGMKREVMVQEKQRIRELAQQVQGEIEVHGTYEPQYIEIEGDDTVSRMMRVIGSIADVALMFIPGAPELAEAEKAITAVSKVKNAAEVANTAKNAAQTVSKFTQAMNQGKQALQVAKKVQQTATNVAQKSPLKFLEFATLEYWLGKLGTLFDTPPSWELDKEHQNAYLNRQNELTSKYQQYAAQELRNHQELNLIRSDEEKAAKERELTIKYRDRVEKELEQEREKRERATLNKLREQFIETMAQQYTRELDSLIESLTIDVQKACELLCGNLVLSIALDSQQQLQQLKSNLEELQSLRTESTDVQALRRAEMERFKSVLAV